MKEIADSDDLLESITNSQEMRELQEKYLEEHSQLWQAVLFRGQGAMQEFLIKPEHGDRRFAAPEWRESPVFDYFYQSYLLNSRYLKELAELLPAENSKFKNRMRFLVRQMSDALSPANFAATNPEFIKLALETQGQSITEGINNLIHDYEKGRISMTDESAFDLGRNVAVTSGAVIYENEVMQLLQYSPVTPKVNKRPMLVVPPCINKFYILDLQPDNSFIRYMLELGNTVFLVSWRNPGEAQGHLGWENYLEQGPIAALKVVREITRSETVNALGFCVGGTILASALAVLAARGENKIASLTLLTTLLDFSDTGELGIFIDEQSVSAREETIGKGGLLPARDLQNTFSFLRANDLVWNYVTNNYLKGRKPVAFDLLFWNSDSTNLPGPFAAWYLRNTYLENNLCVPNKLKMLGEPVDLGRLKMPTYVLATREDHIVPWRSAFMTTQLVGGESRFVLGASGHIAGVVNPASKNKRSFWTGGDQSGGADAWLASATESPGSWWPDWADWLALHSNGQRAAPKKLGNAKYPPIEPAPGRYVKQRAT
ncbi:MAG: class I poly(R)-hydroxyalkanoic acid synthase [Betaproteobacteria bacterium]